MTRNAALVQPVQIVEGLELGAQPLDGHVGVAQLALQVLDLGLRSVIRCEACLDALASVFR